MTLVVLTLVAPLTLSAPSDAHAEAAAVPFQDYGDAPDSSNKAGLEMDAYPGVTANFPTDVGSDGPPGPYHAAVATRLTYMLGYGVTVEENAGNGNDDDDINNIWPNLNEADLDGDDDGVALPAAIPHCTPVEIQVAVTVIDRGQEFPEEAFINLWLDFDRNGHWGEQMTCPAAAIANEWAVANHAITLPAAGTHIITLPAFVAWNAAPGTDMWMRVTLSEKAAPAADGSGPEGGYTRGETEDYRLENVASPSPPISIPPTQVGDLKSNVPFKIHLPLTSVPPGLDFPGGLTTPSGNLNEVAIAHLGGSTDGPTMPLVVTVAGTGTAGQLSSWTMASPVGAPTFLMDGPTQIGYNHQLHVLTPPTSPKLDHEMLVSALIRDGNLWITTWHVADDGSFQQLDTRGYGKNAGVTVTGYTMAHRPLVVTQDEQRHQLVTPILHNGGDMRLITWEINGISGTISAKSDSGDVAANADANADIAAVFAEGEGFVVPHYTVSLSDQSGNLANLIWTVTADGIPTLSGSAASGRDIQNSANVVQSAQNVALAPLNDTGFIAAVNAGGGSLKLLTWENLVAGCNESCQYVPSNISDNFLDLNQAGPGILQSLPTLTTQRAMLRDPLYQDDFYSVNPDAVQSIASVRKVMVTIVTLDAIAAGTISLDDPVTVSAGAAGVNATGADAMGLQENEVISLRDLLHGMMMVSAGDATWAISEYVGGSVDGMIDLMNAKAADLGLTNTYHCQEGSKYSSVAYSTAREQALLWESAYNNPLFLEIVGQTTADVCGTLEDNTPICHPAIPPMTKSMNQYPNLDGWKTGAGGGKCMTPPYDALLKCVSSGCLAVQSTRLQRPLIITELQPTGFTGNRWPDSVTLFDYGYRQIFTPDFRGSSGDLGGEALDFGLDYLTDTHAVTAALTDDRRITVCNWSTDAGLGTVSTNNNSCSEHEVEGLAEGQAHIPPTQLAMVRISTLEAEGDYLLGRLEGGKLVLRLWRVGEKDF